MTDVLMRSWSVGRALQYLTVCAHVVLTTGVVD